MTERSKQTTVIDNVEVFDSEGTMALQIDGWDMFYLSINPPAKDEPPGRPTITPEQHQRIIDVIAEALGFDDERKEPEFPPAR